MIYRFWFILFSCLSCALNGFAQPADPLSAFSLEQVKLLDGPFKHATDLNLQSLLRYQPDRLLSRFRTEAGLQPKAEPYDGWEGQSLAGHSLGHHLSACALMYQTSGEQQLFQRVTYIVAELAQIQQANGGGYLGAFSNGKRIFEEEIARGNIRSQGFDLNGIWAPFYTHHKVMAGLMDAYNLLGHEPALQVARNFADWIATIVTPLSHEQVQEMLKCEFGGIQDALAQVYAATGEEKYLRLARVFHHDEIINPLTAGEDILPGKHGNTQIPKLIAAARLYELTGTDSDRKAADFFWNTVVAHHSYATGGHGNHEYFGQPDQLTHRLSEGTTETCNVYNMLKLSEHLFRWEPDTKVADFYERALFNHILSAQHPDDGRVIYNLSLAMGGKKSYQDPESFTCCVGSGMETHSKYGGSIYFHRREQLFVSQFVASTLNWQEQGVQIVQETRFPEEQYTTLTVHTPEPKLLDIRLRYPHWATSGVSFLVNGEPQELLQVPGTFVSLRRTWREGDRIEMRFPFSLRTEAMPDDPNRVAVFHGPVLLAGDLGPEDDPHANQQDYVPVFLTENHNPEAWLQAVPGQVNTFQSFGNTGLPREVLFRPLYQVHNRRYSVYFDLFNKAQWNARQADYQAELDRKRRLEDMTYDAFQPGEMQPERDHQFKGEKLMLEEDFMGRKARGADRGGWMSWEMKVMKGQPMSLVIEYWGGFTGSKTFDILINDQKIATENISGKQDGAFIDVTYEIPDAITAVTSSVKVTFMPHIGHRAGPFFFARTIKR